MTTYQDPPLQSRRAARQGERAEAENASAETSAERPNAAGAAEPLNDEPLNYATTSRPPLPQYDGQSLRPRRTVASPDDSRVDSADDSTGRAEAPTEALQDAPGYRPRDYSPEGRRAAPSWGPQYGGVADDGTVEFQTQARENVPTPEAAVEPSGESTLRPAADPVAAAEPAAQSPVVNEHAEHTMTRRELRALREAGLITDVTDLSQPIQLPVPPAADTVAEVPVADQVDAPVAEPIAPTAEPVADGPVDEPAAQDVQEHAQEPAEVPAAVAPIAEPIPLVAPAPQTSTRLDSALAEFDALAAGREPLVASPDAPTPLTGRRAAAPPIEGEADGANDATAASAEPSAADLFPQPEALPPSTEGLSAFDALFQPPSAAIPVVVAVPVDADIVYQDVVEAQIEPDPTLLEPTGPEPSEPEQTVSEQTVPEPTVPEPAAQSDDSVPTPPDTVVDPFRAAPAPQGAPALVPPPPIAYPTPYDLSPPPATQAPLEVAPTPFSVGAPPVAPVAEPTVGHWSTQADIDDAEQINESTISRSVGAGNGAITTSALVLPSVPDHTIGGPMGDGGEILLTGSISLPGSLSATGAHPSQLDESDLDHLLDPGDHQVAATDSTPVRAIRAVSTHTASGGIISPSRPKGTRGFTILIIAASVMAVVVVGLLVAGLVSGTL